MNIQCTVKNDSETPVRWNIAPNGVLNFQDGGASVSHDVSVVQGSGTNVRYIRDEAQDEASIDVTNDGDVVLSIVSKQVQIDTLDPGATKTYALPPRPDGIRVKLS